MTSERLDELVAQNMEESYQIEDQFFQEYCEYLKQYPTVISRYRRLCRELSRDYRIILKAEIIPTLSSFDQQRYYDMLKDFGLRVLDEALDCVCEIATSSSPLKEVNKWKKIPWFDIQIHDDNYYVVTFQGISYGFQPIRSIYEKDVERICELHRIENFSLYGGNGYDAYAPGNLDYACHFSSYHFALMHPEVYGITSICPHTTKDGVWYHSYNLSYDEQVVYDVSNGFIMPYDSFQKLLEPMNLDQTLGSDILERQQQLLHSHHSFYREYGDYCPFELNPKSWTVY